MPAHVVWLIQDQVIYVQCVGIFIGEDLHNMITAIQALRNTSPATGIHIIGEARSISLKPVSLSQIRQTVPIMRGSKERGWTITITANSLLRYIVSVFSKLTLFRNHYVYDLESAFAFLAKYDQQFDLTDDGLWVAFYEMLEVNPQLEPNPIN